MFDSQFHAKAAAKLNQMLTDPNGQRSFLGKIVASRKAPTKASLGAEVEVLRPGNYFGQEGLLQKDEVTSFSSVANEYTELLMIDSSTFNDVFLAHFEKDLYDKALCLVNLDLFSNWSPNLLRQLALSVKEVYYGNSDCLYRQGMSLSHVLILKSGSVKLSTGNNSKPAQELLDQIVPPKDFLSDILSETSIAKRPFKSHRRSPDTLQLSASPSVTRNTFHLRSRTLQRHSVSAPPLRKQTTSHKHSEIPKPIISFRPQEPRPHSTSQLCCLGPGDMLNHIEMLCNVKHSLFNASSLSDTVVYMVDTFTFMQLLEKKSLNSLHTLVKQTIERIQVWNDRNSSILIFKPLLEVLQQTEKRTRIAANHHTRKPKLSVVHSPEKLAYITVKHLGKYFSKGFQVVADTPKVQVESIDIAVPLSDALIRKQFFIRQLTSKSLDASYVHVSKEHTSFDAPLPKSCNISSCSSKEIDSSALSSQNSTDEENIAPIASKPLTPTSIRPSSNPIITPPEGCSNINLKDLLGCNPQKYSSATKTEKPEILKQQYLRIGPNTPVKDQDILRYIFVDFMDTFALIINFSAIAYQLGTGVLSDKLSVIG